MCNCGAATETTINNLLRCRLHSVQRKELLDGVYKLYFTLHSPSEDQLRTVLLYGPAKFLYLVFLFLFSLYLFICYSFMSDCTGLTVSDCILLEFCFLFRPQLVLVKILVKILYIYIIE